MQKNVGGYDRLARFIFGPVLIVIGGLSLGGFLTLAAGVLGVALGAIAVLVGAVLTTTAIIQKCPLNAVFGINTYKGEIENETADESIKPGAKPN